MQISGSQVLPQMKTNFWQSRVQEKLCFFPKNFQHFTRYHLSLTQFENLMQRGVVEGWVSVKLLKNTFFLNNQYNLLCLCRGAYGWSCCRPGRRGRCQASSGYPRRPMKRPSPRTTWNLIVNWHQYNKVHRHILEWSIKKGSKTFRTKLNQLAQHITRSQLFGKARGELTDISEEKK